MGVWVCFLSLVWMLSYDMMGYDMMEYDVMGYDVMRNT